MQITAEKNMVGKLKLHDLFQELQCMQSYVFDDFCIVQRCIKNNPVKCQILQQQKTSCILISRIQKKGVAISEGKVTWGWLSSVAAIFGFYARKCFISLGCQILVLVFNVIYSKNWFDLTVELAYYVYCIWFVSAWDTHRILNLFL